MGRTAQAGRSGLTCSVYMYASTSDTYVYMYTYADIKICIPLLQAIFVGPLCQVLTCMGWVALKKEGIVMLPAPLEINPAATPRRPATRDGATCGLGER